MCKNSDLSFVLHVVGRKWNLSSAFSHPALSAWLLGVSLYRSCLGVSPGFERRLCAELGLFLYLPSSWISSLTCRCASSPKACSLRPQAVWTHGCLQKRSFIIIDLPRVVTFFKSQIPFGFFLPLVVIHYFQKAFLVFFFFLPEFIIAIFRRMSLWWATQHYQKQYMIPFI